MSEERRKTNKSSTGTVPKIKQRNDIFTGIINQARSRSLTNNAGYWQQPSFSNLIRNHQRNPRKNYYKMDAALEEENMPVNQNGIGNISENMNGSSANSSSSASRRNSSTSALKCDNMTKYPDKKQIEDKLHQIQEYLKITNSLMNNLKNTDDHMGEMAERENLEKMIKDLKDSENKLLNILDQMSADQEPVVDNQVITNGCDGFSERSSSLIRKPDSDINLDTHIDIESLKDQQMTLLKLQQKAEKRLRDARQSNLFNTRCQENDAQNVNDSNNYQRFDNAIKELEERARRLTPAEPTQQLVHDSIMAKVESLHNQIMVMHNANDKREELIQTLDNRDAELRSQHDELQSKLVELQDKKMQVDKLVAQLQNFGEDEEEDITGQVRKIVTMKDQLKKLKDMLELVKNTETIMQNTNASPEAQAAACEICTTAENFLEKEFQKPNVQQSVPNASNVLRYDNNTSSDNIPKQLNKNSKKQEERGAYPKASSISQKIALQTELESKKRELEDLMGKHKASTSNLNHDVGIDTKSEYSCASNTVNEAWAPLLPSQHHGDSDRFSSDECEDDVNHYQEINDNHNVVTLSSNYSPLNTSKRRLANVTRSEYLQHAEYERPLSSSRTLDTNARSSSVATSNCVREQPRANADKETKNQVQKQLQLIKSVCDSMLEQQSTMPQTNPNVHHLRNNLTPSPLYSEPQRYATPNAQALNTVNVTNPNVDVPWFSNNSELNNYQGWLTTNTIQTQSFMLNTLNQCCQMLWLQQRELVTLRNTVSMLQERIENLYEVPQDHLPSSLRNTPQENRSASNQYRTAPNQKINHVSAAYSLPNLNQYNAHPPNMETNYINHNNSHVGLNNTNINHLNVPSMEHANNDLHGVNANINHSLPNQMWNGQALNNQVAPGNRANNYWDNFRSYSRQNLLSTKNSEVLQNSLSSIERTDRPNTISERTNPFAMMTFSKSNSEQDSTSTSQENTPQKRGGSFRHENARIQPDVLNINQTVHKSNEHLDLASASNAGNHHEGNDITHGFPPILNLNSFNDNASNHSNLSEEHTLKDSVPDQQRRHNEWTHTTPLDHIPKSKLFDELRDNVYKEVVSLISANESRPHFLIQLFRDLQMIGSDTLRLKILQSIQMIATHSLLHSQNSKRIPSEPQPHCEQDISLPEYFSMQSTVWSKPVKNSSNNPKCNDFTEFQNLFKGAVPFLNDNEEEIIQNSFIACLKQILLNSVPFKETVKDCVFQKHFSNIFDEIFEPFIGKKVKDVKIHLLQTLNELFCGELGFIQIIHETNSEKESLHPDDLETDNVNGYTSVANYEHPKIVIPSQSVEIQNGDLCEADQTRVLNEDMEEEEEGAVGGILETKDCFDTSHQSNCEDLEVTLELACNAEGLDQIPTRLPIKTKSRSVTPNKDETLNI